MLRLKVRQKLASLLLVQQLYRLVYMGQYEAVHADHHRSSDLSVLGDLVGLEGGIHRLLNVLGIDLNPAHIASPYGILLVVPDVERRSHGPVGHIHDQGHPQAGDIVEHLVHQSQALAGGGGVASAAGSADTHQHGKSGELGVHREKFAIKLTICHHLG